MSIEKDHYYEEGLMLEKWKNSKSLAQQRLSVEDARREKVEQFWNPQNHPDPEDPKVFALSRIARHTHMPESALPPLPWSAVILIEKLLEVRNIEAARQALRSPVLLSLREDLLIKAAAEALSYYITQMGGPPSSLDLPIELVKAEIKKRDQDHFAWSRILRKELQELDLDLTL